MCKHSRTHSHTNPHPPPPYQLRVLHLQNSWANETFIGLRECAGTGTGTGTGTHVHTHAIYGEIVNKKEETRTGTLLHFSFSYFSTLGRHFRFWNFTFYKRCTHTRSDLYIHTAMKKEVAAPFCIHQFVDVWVCYVYCVVYTIYRLPPKSPTFYCAHLAHGIFCLSAWTHVGVCVRLAWIMEIF